MTTQLNQLTELTTTSDDDLILIREDATGVDKKMRAQNIRAKATTKDDVGLGNVTNDAQFKLADAGTAATADVTTSVTDTTAGRLLKVGDFGLAGAAGALISLATANDDANEINRNGFYTTTSSTLNTPSLRSNSSIIHAESNNSAVQVWSRRGGEQFYIRQKEAGTWADWRELYHTGNLLGTVSESAGVPTGAVIERGSNANGEYVRFADGTQICTYRVILDNTNISIASGEAANWEDVDFAVNDGPSFPIAFSGEVPMQVVSCGGDAAGPSGRSTLEIYCQGGSSTRWRRCSFRHNGTSLSSNPTSGVPLAVNFLAIGRWF